MVLIEMSDPQGVDSDQHHDDVDSLSKAFGKCKWFNVAKGYGFVEPESKETVDENGLEQNDIFVYQSVIQMPGFRSLREGERVEIWYKKSNQGWEATRVSGPDGENCLGSDKRPKRRKRPDRCYNCGEGGHHAKECQFPPLPKRCHHCKSAEHLVALCPTKSSSVSTQSEVSSPGRNESSSVDVDHSE